MGRRIDVVEYDPSWPARYDQERSALAAVFSDILESIHHIGSTSVPGLAAKPTIDILVVVRETDDLGARDSSMVGLGYRPRGECLDGGGTPGRFYYSKEVDGRRTHHVHVCGSGHWQIAELLAFPAYLRAHPEEAGAYAAMKQAAVVTAEYDNTAYMATKAQWLGPRIRAALQSQSPAE